MLCKAQLHHQVHGGKRSFAVLLCKVQFSACMEQGLGSASLRRDTGGPFPLSAWRTERETDRQSWVSVRVWVWVDLMAEFIHRCETWEAELSVVLFSHQALCVCVGLSNGQFFLSQYQQTQV